MLLTGILRELAYSPFQHAENDRLILEATTAVLRHKGAQVQIITEAEVGRRRINSSVIFSMCQGPRANLELEKLEDNGTLIINSPRAVKNCYRLHLTRLLDNEDFAFAPTTILNIPSDPTIEMDNVRAQLPWALDENNAVWIKRGDVHATQQGDVVKITSLEDLAAIIVDFRRRGIAQAAVQQHIDGQVIKFYGVVDSPFFRFYSEKDHKVSPVAMQAARPSLERLIRKMNLEVYGGDAVLTEDGRVFIIDINDWPSFAYFRHEAAEVIGQHIYQRALLHLSTQAEAALSQLEGGRL